MRTASVELPATARDEVALEDDASHVSVRFRLENARNAGVEIGRRLALYRGAVEFGDLVHRVSAEGTEDFVVFERKPTREELAYRVDVTRVAGLRLVSNSLEFLDEGGAPRLRISPPWVVDAAGTRREAKLILDGCAYDADTSGPWGRPVTSPAAPSCGVRVQWSGVEYPAIVDPSWGATGSMANARSGATATLLPSGKVLITGGGGAGTFLSTAELFDGTGSFAATGSMATVRGEHTATLLTSGKVLIAGGRIDASGTMTSSAELFDGMGTFLSTGSLTAVRGSHAAALLKSGRVLIVGGQPNGSTEYSTAELFDGTSSFTATGSMSTLRDVPTATLLPSGKVLVAGGVGGGGGFWSTAELFDGTSAFTTTGSMTTTRAYHSATLLGSGKVLIAGGCGSKDCASAELFDGTSTFATTGSMTTSRTEQSAALFGSGKVLVVGGLQLTPTAGVSSAELFDGTGSFAAIGSLSAGRWQTTATLLNSGSVLVAGGYNGVNSLSTAELLGPSATGTACSVGGDCASGFCADGVCCNSACTGTCQACSAAKKLAGADGTCGAIVGCTPDAGADSGGDGGGDSAVDAGGSTAPDSATSDSTTAIDSESDAPTRPADSAPATSDTGATADSTAVDASACAGKKTGDTCGDNMQCDDKQQCVPHSGGGGSCSYARGNARSLPLEGLIAAMVTLGFGCLRASRRRRTLPNKQSLGDSA